MEAGYPVLLKPYGLSFGEWEGEVPLRYVRRWYQDCFGSDKVRGRRPERMFRI